jgi:hypothetical protein
MQVLRAAAAVFLAALIAFVAGVALSQQVVQTASSLLIYNPNTGRTIIGTANNGIDLIIGGHLSAGQGSPTANSCAGFSLAAGSTDVAGALTYSSATTCSVNFSRSYTQNPVCQVLAVNATTPAVGSTTTTITGWSVTFAAAQTSLTYECWGI